MMKFIFYQFFFISSLFFGSNEMKYTSLSLDEYEDFHHIINAYLLEKDFQEDRGNIAVVIEETFHIIKKSAPIEIDGMISIPSFNTAEVSLYRLKKLEQQNILGPGDGEYIYSKLNSLNDPKEKIPFVYLDSKLIKTSLISNESLNEIFSDLRKGWKKFHSKYKGCYLSFSYPLFNEDRNKVYLHTEKMCGRLNGHGEVVVFEKINEVWQVIYREQTWVS